MQSGERGGFDIRFAYYLIQLRTEQQDGLARSSGTLENLGTGERVPFADLEHLVGILSRDRNGAGSTPLPSTPIGSTATPGRV